MNVLYVYDGNWPRNATRVVKQTRSLASAGHVVHLISRNELREARREQSPWMTVNRLPSVRSRLLNHIINFPYFFNPFWIWCIWSCARAMKADCIVVADLPLALTAVWVGRALRIPVHYDVVEPYPEALRSQWQFDRMRFTDPLVRNPKIAEWVERRVLAQADQIFVVSDESRDRSIRQGARAEHVVVVSNTPENAEEFFAPQPFPVEYEPWRDRLRVIFTGILRGDRGLHTAVEAIKLLETRVPEAVLIIVGDGAERDRVEQTIARLNLQQRVILLGWQDHGRMPEFCAHAHVGLLPFLDCNHIRITLANKLFDYMAAGLPLVASDVPPMRRILDETKAGVLFKPGDAADLANAIEPLLRSEALRAELSTRGQAAVRTTYHWGADERRFLHAVARAHGEASASPQRVAS
ncbi:MAG: glycosyltransferase family 4 protein [Longimicrobiales bacterium]